jgi:putative salt-induced outer membrane protein YdiY
LSPRTIILAVGLAGALAVLTALSAVVPVRAGIVNSLRGWSEEEQGWSGALAGSYGASGGNSPQSTFEGSGRVQLRSRANVWRLIASGNRTTVQGVETKSSTLGHLRHNYLLNDRWATLAFLQQYRNPFQRLDSRFLLGVGGRWRAVKGEKTLIYLGAAYMFEQERIQGEEGHDKAQRLSAFASLEADLKEEVVVDFLLFYQPQWSDFSDWRFYGEAALEVELTGSLSLFVSYKLEHNSTPPEGVEQTDWSTKTGLAFKF